jgi:predicted RNase H-like HicB family nuclease/DNA-binding XRE family transcriptional regulator
MRYPAIVKKDGRHLVALFPTAPGCQTQGDSEAQMQRRAAEALQGWLEAQLQERRVPPRPGRARAAKGDRLIFVTVPAQLAVRLWLVWARVDAGLSQAKLARRAGVSQQAIAKLEHPDSNPTIATLERVARALGTRLRVSLDRGDADVSR